MVKDSVRYYRDFSSIKEIVSTEIKGSSREEER